MNQIPNNSETIKTIIAISNNKFTDTQKTLFARLISCRPISIVTYLLIALEREFVRMANKETKPPTTL